jgi:hypothetical protein
LESKVERKTVIVCSLPPHVGVPVEEKTLPNWKTAPPKPVWEDNSGAESAPENGWIEPAYILVNVESKMVSWQVWQVWQFTGATFVANGAICIAAPFSMAPQVPHG